MSSSKEHLLLFYLFSLVDLDLDLKIPPSFLDFESSESAFESLEGYRSSIEFGDLMFTIILSVDISYKVVFLVLELALWRLTLARDLF